MKHSSRVLQLIVAALAYVFFVGCATYRPLSPAAPGYRESRGAALCDSMPLGTPIQVTLDSGHRVIGTLASTGANQIAIARGGASYGKTTVIARADVAAVATATRPPEAAHTAATVIVLLAAFVGAIMWSISAGGGM